MSPMLPRKERPFLDSNLNEDDRLLPKDKDKSRNSLFNLIKKKKKTAPAPPKRSSSFRDMDGHAERLGLAPDPRDDFNNVSSAFSVTHTIDPSKFPSANNNGVGGITNGGPTYPGPLFPLHHARKKGTPVVPSVVGKTATTPPNEEDIVSNSKRFLRSSSASSMPPGSERTEWKSVTLPRDLHKGHFDSGTFRSKPALPRKRANEKPEISAPRMGTLTPPPRLPKKTEDMSDEVFKDAEPSLLTPKLGRRLLGLGVDSSKTSALQAELLKPNVFPALGAAGDECRARRHKPNLDSSGPRERGKFQKTKPAPPPPPPSSAKISRSPTHELPSPTDAKASDPHYPSSFSDQVRSPLEAHKKLNLNTSSKPQPLKTSSSSVSGSTSSPLGFSSLNSPGDQASPTAFIPLMNTRRSLRKTRALPERQPNSAITREMVLEGTELLRTAIGRNSEQTGSHSAVLEAGKNLSKYCVSYVDSIQQMRNKFAFREAINKLESSLRELQICPAATGGASGAQQDFSKLLSSVKEISDIVQR